MRLRLNYVLQEHRQERRWPWQQWIPTRRSLLRLAMKAALWVPVKVRPPPGRCLKSRRWTTTLGGLLHHHRRPGALRRRLRRLRLVANAAAITLQRGCSQGCTKRRRRSAGGSTPSEPRSGRQCASWRCRTSKPPTSPRCCDSGSCHAGCRPTDAHANCSGGQSAWSQGPRATRPAPATCKTNRDGGNTVSCRTGDTFRTVRSGEYSPSCPGWRR